MYLFPFSDLHININEPLSTELLNWEELKQYNDNLVLCACGDICERTLGVLFLRDLQKYIGGNTKVVYVAGNHEYYNSSIQYLNQDLHKTAKYFDNIHVLSQNNPSVVIDDIEFIGSTLWTDYNNNTLSIKNNIQDKLNDYRCIRTSSHSITGNTVLDMHLNQKKVIFNSLNKSKNKCVVLTHHQPFIPPEIDKLTYGFCTDLSKELEQCTNVPYYWFSGHTHKSHYKKLDNCETQFISNQYGYYFEESTGFSMNCIMEI